VVTWNEFCVTCGVGAVAELERSLIIERIKAGLKKAEAAEHKPGRKIGAKGPSRSTLWRRARAASEQAAQQ